MFGECCRAAAEAPLLSEDVVACALPLIGMLLMLVDACVLTSSLCPHMVALSCVCLLYRAVVHQEGSSTGVWGEVHVDFGRNRARLKRLVQQFRG